MAYVLLTTEPCQLPYAHVQLSTEMRQKPYVSLLSNLCNQFFKIIGASNSDGYWLTFQNKFYVFWIKSDEVYGLEKQKGNPLSIAYLKKKI